MGTLKHWFAALWLWTASLQAGATDLPNILLVMADDLGYGDTGIFQSSDIPTPNIDALAAAGTRFSRHYTDSTCSPSRAALLTGLYPARVGIQPNGLGISEDVNTMARALGAVGYRTHHIGKWHLGGNTADASPLAAGFDSALYFANQWLLSGKRDENGRPVPGRPSYRDPYLARDGQAPRQYMGHLEDLLADRAQQIIAEADERPWFINLWHYAPHAPVQAANRFLPKEGELSRQIHYRGLVRQLDSNLGKLLQQSQKSGRETLLIFLSDNGSVNLASNQPFAGRKGQYREGGLRTPLLMTWPGRIAAGVDISDVAHIQDIFPTVMELVGAPLAGDVDGRSLAGLFRSQALQPRIAFWESISGANSQYSVLSSAGDWRLSGLMDWSGTVKSQKLYDLRGDPSGATDELSREPAVADNLYKRYLDWHEQVHRLPLQIETRGENGAGVVTGLDLQRTPGWGPWTFAIAFEPPSDPGQPLQTIAQQAGLWAARFRPADRRIRVTFGSDWELPVGPAPGNSCQSLLISGFFKRKINHWKDDDAFSALAIYHNGESAISQRRSVEIDRPAAHAAPLFIGMDESGGRAFAGRLGRPLLLSVDARRSPVFKPNLIHETLCAELADGP